MNNNENTGIVVDIERFSTQNGPGIRTTVFMKGCPLRCNWCGNPETQSFIPEIMVMTGKCSGCGKCTEVCPNAAITITEDKVSVRFDRCLNCLKCTEVCMDGAIRRVGTPYTAEEIYQAVIRDKEFYGTRGGVTFTGGEPLSQWKVLLPVLKRLKEDGIGVCMDTTGDVAWAVLEKVKEYVNIFLYDVKHLDSGRHRNRTGVGNERILENLSRLAASGACIWLRAPIIPGYNDSEIQLRKLAELARDLDAARLCLLPYHTLGREKYRQLGREYPTGNIEAYSAEEIVRAREIASRYFTRVYV